MKTKKAKAENSIEVHYTGRFEDGEVFDSSKGKDPSCIYIKQRSAYTRI